MSADDSILGVIKIPEETLRKWLEEFENLYLGKWTEFDVCRRAAREAFIAAKTSSYESDQYFKQRNKDLFDANLDYFDKNRKLQERIKELEKFCAEFVYGEENPEYYKTMDEKLAKRDQLLEQAKPWIENHKRFLGEGFFFNEEFDEWLKQVEELKGEK